MQILKRGTTGLLMILWQFSVGIGVEFELLIGLPGASLNPDIVHSRDGLVSRHRTMMVTFSP